MSCTVVLYLQRIFGIYKISKLHIQGHKSRSNRSKRQTSNKRSIAGLHELEASSSHHIQAAQTPQSQQPAWYLTVCDISRIVKILYIFVNKVPIKNKNQKKIVHLFTYGEKLFLHTHTCRVEYIYYIPLYFSLIFV